MSKEINLSDGTGLKIETINFNIGKGIKNELGLYNTDKLRYFLPDWKKLLSSESFLDPFLKRYGIGQIYKPAIACYLEYYRATNFDFAGKPLKSSLKNIRTFKINSMEYKNLLWEILVKERKSRPALKEEDLKLKIEFPILDVTGHSVHNLFLKAAYKEITKPEQTPRGQESYTKKFFKKIIHYYIHINNEPHLKSEKDKTRMYYSAKEIKVLKEYLSEDRIFEELRSTNFNNTLNKVKKLLCRYRQIEGQSESSLQKDKNKKIVNNDELKSIVNETINSLNEFLAEKKSTKKKEKIQEWINRIQHFYSQPEPVNLTVLVYINDKFTSKQGLIDHINLRIEMLFRRCYREWAKKSFDEINRTESLTKPEKRLFILMHIGTPYLNYRTPIFDSLLLKYLNFKGLTLSTFLLSSVFKVHKIDEIDLKLMNLHLFLSFLKFYAFWLNYIRPKEKDRKQNVEFKKRVVTDQFIEKTAWEEKDLDEYKLKKGKEETKIPEYEEIDLSDFEMESDETENELYNSEINFHQSDSSEDDTDKTEIDQIHYGTISVKKPGVDLKKVNNFNLMELWFNDILETHCDSQERKLLTKYLIEGYNYDEIGGKMNISGPAVHKRVKKILERLFEVPELRDILTEM